MAEVAWKHRLSTSVCEQIYNNNWLLYVQAAAPGEGPVEAAAGPRQRTVGQQQSVWSGQNSGRDLSNLGETGRATNDHTDRVDNVIYMNLLVFMHL